MTRAGFATRDRGELNHGMANHRRAAGQPVLKQAAKVFSREEVERVINAHPLVQQAFVVPVEDKEFGHVRCGCGSMHGTGET